MSPSTESSSVDPNLLSPPTSTPVSPLVFYSHSTRNRLVTPPQNVSILTSTPIFNKTSGNHSYASETHDLNYRLAKETSSQFLGVMPLNKFLDTFLLIGKGTLRSPMSKRAFKSVLRVKKEVDMYAPFVRSVLCFFTYCALPTFNS